MRKKGWLLCAVAWAAVVLTGCGNVAEGKSGAGWSGTEQSDAGQSNIGQIIGESVDEVLTAKEQAVGAAQYPEPIIPTEEKENPALTYREMPDLEVDYIPELNYSGYVQIHETYDPHGFACWKDILIIGDTVYRREDGIYQRTEERLQDWFELSDRDEIARTYQWENLLAADYNRDEIKVLDMDSGELRTYPFDGYIWNGYRGKLYYREIGKGVLCMDLLSGEVEVIYACEGGGSFEIRDNGDMIINTGNKTDPRVWEFWLLSYDARGNLRAEKIWETDTYEYVETLMFYDSGLFFVGEYYDSVGLKGGGLFCLKDNGESEEVELPERWTLSGQLIAEEGYFFWDSQMLTEEEKLEILGSWSWNRPREAETVVDSITYYDFQGNKLKTWKLIEDELLEAGYRMKCIVYDNGEILAFYENEEFDDLYISKIQTLADNTAAVEGSGESESKETDARTAVDIKAITCEQVDYNVVRLHFIFEDTVIYRETVADSVRDIVWEDITGDGVEEALIYCDFANNTCDWQLVYFYQIDGGNVTDISPTGEDIPALQNADGELWNMWIAAETMEGYSSPVYKLESYDKEQGEVYVEETLYIGYRDGKWELVQGYSN